jgi:Mg-chelatase subunit ChlD
MKYCRICKTTAKDTDTVCAKGHALSVFGAGSSSPAPATGHARPSPQPSPVQSGAAKPTAMMFTLQGRVQELEAAKKVNIVRERSLSFLSLLILLLILFILYQVYSRTVLAYAVIENIEFEQDPIYEQQITVRFDVKTPGRVILDRRSGIGRTEKTDEIAKTGKQKIVWAWPSDPKTGIDFNVVSRGTLFRTSLDKHFDVTRSDVGVEVVFLIDITSSMGPFIEGLKRNCNEFAEQIRKQGVDCQLGLVAFGDVDEGDAFVISEPTDDISKFESDVAMLQMTNGGDAPESSVEALEKALAMELRPHTRVCFVHITDERCHHPERLPEIAQQLKERNIVTYVISDPRRRNLYNQLCVNGGAFHGIGEANFAEILKDVAKSISNAIKAD